MIADRRPGGRSLSAPLIALLLMAVSAGIRAVVAAALPVGAWSADLNSWLLVGQLLHQGLNPYNQTTLLNWPPAWMQILAGLEYFSVHAHLPLVRVIQGFLIAGECALTGVTYLMLRGWGVGRPGLIVLVGLVLNPVAIILTAIHGNFDVLVGLCVVLFLGAMARWHRSGDPADWLLACLFLGLGILLKTVPVVLIPLLVLGWRRLSPRFAVIGAALVLGPIALGLSVIGALGLRHVISDVVQYRSGAGSFGITGIMTLTGWPAQMAGYAAPASGVGVSDVSAHTVYTAAFVVLLAVLAALTVWGLARRAARITYRHLAYLTVGLLLVIPVFGPGYATQYAFWWMATAVVAFAVGGRGARIALIIVYLVASATYVVEYAFVPGYGEVAIRLPHPASFTHIVGAAAYLQWQTVVSLPLFVSYLMLLGIFGHELWVGLLRDLRRRSEAATDVLAS